MRNVAIRIEGVTPYSPSQQIEEKKKQSETWDEFELRTWKAKAHTNEKDCVYIPGVSFKMSLDYAAKQVKEKVQGKGGQTWGPIFASGVAAISDLDLGLKLADLKHIRLQCSSNGKPNGGSRVPRWFPYIPTWGGQVEMRIFNDQIQEAIFERYFEAAGLIAGVGRGRPQMGCAAGNGRYRPVSFKWTTLK